MCLRHLRSSEPVQQAVLESKASIVCALSCTTLEWDAPHGPCCLLTCRLGMDGSEAAALVTHFPHGQPAHPLTRRVGCCASLVRRPAPPWPGAAHTCRCAGASPLAGWCTHNCAHMCPPACTHRVVLCRPLALGERARWPLSTYTAERFAASRVHRTSHQRVCTACLMQPRSR